MFIPIRHIRDDERGMSVVFVCVGLMSFVAATTLAIDVGMLMTSRNQAQNAADAGALAGATALVFDSYDDRSSGGPAVQSAIGTATFNEVMDAAVSVTPADVTFPVAPSGESNRVSVTVFRNAARSNPVTLLMAPIFGVAAADIDATATAEAARANAVSCVAPFAIPDKWTERQTPTWDPTDTFNAFPANPSLQPDVYYTADRSDYTGYDPYGDRGQRLTIRIRTGTSLPASSFVGLALPGSSGTTDYQANLTNCNPSVHEFGTLLNAEASSVTDATRLGVEQLIALDPSAYWDTTTNRVVSSLHPSPRLKTVPVFDPYYWNLGKQSGRFNDLRAANYIGFFIEGLSGNDVIGRIAPVTAFVDSSAAPAPPGAFPRAIRLVQ